MKIAKALLSFCAGLTILSADLANAYIPEYSLIASRAADQHGQGAYKIELEVTYKRDAESYIVKETWLVLGENNLRVTLEGRGALRGLVSGSVIYDGSLKSYTDGEGVKSTRLGDDWLEPLFHFRNSKYFRSRLVNLKVAPAESLKDRAPLSSEDVPQYEAPGFIRLSRAGGAIAWAIGSLPGANAQPTIWIEQDQFVTRKFKGANNILIRADEYAKFDQGLWYPRVRTFTFEPFSVSIKTLQVQSLGRLSNDARFKSTSLSKQDALRLPDSDGLREFYQRFR